MRIDGMPFRRRLAPWFLAALAMLATGLMSRPASASYIFETPSGSTAGGKSVDAKATFTITSGHVHIELMNLQDNPESVIQAVNGVQFVLSSGQTVGSNLTSSAQHRQIDSNDPAPTGWHDLGVSATSWHLNNDVDSGLELTSIDSGGAPQTLIGGPDSSNAYSAAKGSIAGNGPHNPFLAGTAVYDLDISGLPSNATISSMRFEFGTTAGTNVTGQLVPVPEPSSIVLMGLGLGTIGLATVRRQRRKASA